MAKHDDISSTEKLLDLIRENDTDIVPPKPPPLSQASKRWKSRKTVTIGIDFCRTGLKLVKLRQSSGQKWELLGYSKVPFDPHIPYESPEFPAFLHAILSDFCGPGERFDLWLIMSSARVEVRYIRIPKLPKKQVPNAIYWTFKNEFQFDEKENIFDFEILGEVTDSGIQKIEAIAFAAPKQEISKLEGLFYQSGFPLTGISIAPVAIQNLFRTHWLGQEEKTVGRLFVGREWSRIDIFSSGNLVLTRGIKAGMNSLTEGIMEGFNDLRRQSPFEVASGQNGFRPAGPKKEVTIDMEQARKILLSLCPDYPPLKRDDPGYYLGEEDIFTMLLPPLERLVSQIERSLDHYSRNIGDDRVSKIYIGGAITSFKRLLDHISNEVGLPGDIIDPLSREIPILKAVSTPSNLSERASFAPALGMALSNNSRTPNFIFTYKDEERQTILSRANHGIFAGFVLALAACLGIFLWQGRVADKKGLEVNELRHQLEIYSPRLSPGLILHMAARVKLKRHTLMEYSKRYRGVAVIGELSRMTPSNIRLLNIKANLKGIFGDVDEKKGKTLMVEGLIFGESQTLQSSLAAYLVRLEGSPIFGLPYFQKTSIESIGGKDVVHFTFRMKLV